MNLYGIDGCKGGWVVASNSEKANIPSFWLVSDLTDLFATAERGGVIAIDVPIGLSDSSTRQCDVEARRFLGAPRGSSVFPAPSRYCLSAGSYPDACKRNFTASGRMISRQCYGILPKIREVDAIMTANRQHSVREVHPEVAFAVLAEHSMVHRKLTKEGIDERLAVLGMYGVRLTLEDIQHHRREIGRGVVHLDDVIDAAVCLVTAQRIAVGQTRVFGGKERDSRNLLMEIVA